VLVSIVVSVVVVVVGDVVDDVVLTSVVGVDNVVLTSVVAVDVVLEVLISLQPAKVKVIKVNMHKIVSFLFILEFSFFYHKYIFYIEETAIYFYLHCFIYH
jgi:hypothetical protein